MSQSGSFGQFGINLNWTVYLGQIPEIRILHPDSKMARPRETKVFWQKTFGPEIVGKK